MRIAHSWHNFQKILSILVVVIVTGCASSSVNLDQNKKYAKIPVTDAATIQPGLKVRYYEDKYLHITDMPQGEELEKAGKEGKTVRNLNRIYSKSGNVFRTGRSRQVGFWFHGLIHLDKPGQYMFQALANDGIRFFLNDRLIFEDPEKHSDRLTPVGGFYANTPGWYPLQIIYFQRKGTSSLKFYWKTPDSDSFDIVPAEVLGHIIDN